MDKPDGGPAFPCEERIVNHVGVPANAGMSKREYYAAQALPAVIAAYVQGNGSCLGTDHILRNAPAIAFKFADAMLAEGAQ